MRAEQVDALAARNLGVKIVFFGDFAEDDEFVWCDLSGRDAGNNGVEALALNVGEEAVIGVLNRVVVNDDVIPQTRED